MTTLFDTPELDLHDVTVVEELDELRLALKSNLRAPRRWTGGLRRTAQARAIQGSNTIEGYTVSEQDALAAVDDEEPLTADELTWVEIVGYRRVLTYVVNVATQPGFVIDLASLNAMHFMLLEHELSKGPGTYRRAPVYVRDEHGQTVYEGPEADDVAQLMRKLAGRLAAPDSGHPMVRAAMAHLNLVMVHPYRDGNGRMARALQTMVLAGDDVLEPTFSSIEEWLGAHTDDYYRILAHTGGGTWQPDRDAHAWVKFNLRAHHLQAQTVQRRFAEASALWEALDDLLVLCRLPERAADPLFDAALGFRVTRPSYVKRAVPAVELRTATRDLQRLVDLGLLEPRGETRGRFYVAAGQLNDLSRDRLSRRAPLVDPYPGLMEEISRSTHLSG